MSSSLSVWSLTERARTVKSKREELGLSRAELATIAEMDYIVLKEFETGVRDLDAHRMLRLEEALADAIAERRVAGK